MKTVFEFQSYRDYLFERLGKKGERTGQRQAAARAMKCHSTFLSQVLGGRSELALEQASLLNGFLHHSEAESHFFLLLVQRARAGNAGLRAYFEKQIQAVLAQRIVIRDRLKDASSLSEMDEARFYGSWLYGATHVLCSIPRLQTKDALAAELGISTLRMGEILDFLVQLGMAEYQNGRYSMGKSHFHLAATSPNITKHHLNWRVKTLAALEDPAPQDIHYSAAVTLSRKDCQRVRENLLKCLEENVKLISASPSEEGYVYAFDFFKLTR